MDTRSLATSELAPFLNRLEAVFHPELVLLFGSRARGDFHSDSDYDLLIVSDAFAGMKWRDRVSRLLKFWDRLDLVDLMPYTRAEFESKKRDFLAVQAAVKESIQLLPRTIH
jgi:predicted nucleotidyltransferase